MIGLDLNLTYVKEYLESHSSKSVRESLIRMGVQEEYVLGVPTNEIRKFAKRIGVNDKLAYELWQSGIHEYRLLATLLFSKSHPKEDIYDIMNDVNNWALCDHICKSFILDLDYVKEVIFEWHNCEKLYFKRAAFVLISAIVSIREEYLDGHDIDDYLMFIYNEAFDDRIYVKKAVSWALREIGKINKDNQLRAIDLANQLIRERKGVWVGKHALKELNSLIKVEARSRLLSKYSKMANQ